MVYSEIKKIMDNLFSGDSSISIPNLKDTIYISYQEGDISYDDYKSFFNSLKRINLNNRTPFDKNRSGLNYLLSYYYKDFVETNYIDYNLDKKIELDTILEIEDKIDSNHVFSYKESIKYLSFLHELKKEYNDWKILDSIDYMISYIEGNSL